MRLRILLILVLVLGLSSPLRLGRALESGPAGAVATQHPLATEAALRVLREGGNAVDASLAAALTLAVVEPYNSGLGGGGFALVWNPKKSRAEALDFRETAPARAGATMYLQPGLPAEASQVGPLAIAVPGIPAGLEVLHRQYGRLPWARLFNEAIAHAEQGFRPDAVLRNRVAEKSACLSRDYHSAQIYRPLLKGEDSPSWSQRDLAATLKKIRDGGAEEFYRGATAAELATSLRGKGALLDLRDLEQYRALPREALAVKYPFGKIWGMPPPSSGGLGLLQGMNFLEAKLKKDKKGWTEKHRAWLVSAMAEIFRLRNSELGDPAFNPPMPLKRWLKKGGGNTSHLSVMDGEGGAVAMTLTLNLSFGSCVTAGKTGILMNDEMDDFTTRPGLPNAFGLVQGESNRIEPGKRPLSSMAPTLVSKGKRVTLAIGSPGGPRILTSVLQVLARHYFGGEDWTRAVAAARLHFQGEPAVIWGESAQILAGLEKEFPWPTEAKGVWGNVQGVAYDPETKAFQAISDTRGQGSGKVLLPSGARP